MRVEICGFFGAFELGWIGVGVDLFGEGGVGFSEDFGADLGEDVDCVDGLVGSCGARRAGGGLGVFFNVGGSR